MCGFNAKLPITDLERAWVDEGFHRLGSMLGAARMLHVSVVQPTDEFFPDPFEESETGLKTLFRRVALYMKVNPDRLELQVIPDTVDMCEMLLESSSDSAGRHFGPSSDHLALIGVKQSQLKDPLRLVAVLVHELCHVILFAGGHMSREAEDLEAMTDLATVFLGMGVFTANAARRFIQFQDGCLGCWSMSHQGYLSEEIFGYALARFAHIRNESHPRWTKYLNTNVSTYYLQSAAWLAKNKDELK